MPSDRNSEQINPGFLKIRFINFQKNANHEMRCELLLRLIFNKKILLKLKN